jgi:hypothetical protein
MSAKDATHIACEISPPKVRFLELEIEKQADNSWKYTKDVFGSRTGETVGILSEKFLAKIKAGSDMGELNLIKTILCNTAYAAELYVRGVITEEMIASIEAGVVGAGRGMTPLCIIPTQEVVLDDKIVNVQFIIVDCFSHHSFELIDESNGTLLW